MGITGISPVLLVSDIGRSVAYYRDRLGFRCETYGDPPTFASAQRDGSSILLALCPETDRIVPNWRIVDQTWNVYVRVDDADAVYAEVQERGAAIDYTLYDAPHGFREFGVQDPDGYDIAFGQPLADPSVS
jgi:predicted enzyme related to lactoylglutathione lyase